MNFNNQVFNNQFMSEEYYKTVRKQIEEYNKKQNEDTAKTVKAFHDLLEASHNLDPDHQQIAFFACLEEYAKMYGWE